MSTSKSISRDALIIIAAAVGILGFVLTAQQVGGIGFPLDDSWIHQTYGRNLALTGQWAFIPGYPSAGSTSPLYTLLLAAGYALGVPYFIWAFGLGSVALAGGGLIGARLGEQLFPKIPRIGLWAGLAVVTAWHMVWAAASGMETMIFSALALLIVTLALRQRDFQTQAVSGRARFGEGLIFGLAGAALIATRPEGSLLILLAGGALFVLLVTQSAEARRAWLPWWAGALLGGILGLAPYLLLNISLNGSPLPNTFSAKQAENAPLLNQSLLVNLLAMLTPLAAGGQLLLVPGAIAAVLLWLRAPDQRFAQKLVTLVPLLWSVALLLLFTLRLPAPYQHGRYVMPTLPTFIVVGVGGTVWLASKRWRSMLPRILARSLTITVPLIFVWFWFIGSRSYADDVWRINSDMLVASRWLDANVSPAQFLAVHDIGAVGYFASRPGQPRPILDLAGLVSPEVIPNFYQPQAWLDLMRARNVRYLMVLPTQWDDLWLGQPDRWAKEFCLRFNARGGMGGMSIYEFHPGQQFTTGQACP